MKFLLLLAAVLAAASAVSYEDVLYQEFNLFKAEYQKSYENPLENFRRMEAFLENKYRVAQHNLRYRNGEETYEMEINEYSDWLPEQIANMNGEEVSLSEFQGEIFEFGNATVPEKMNWLERGAVTQVRKQGECAAGYAISSTGALEAQKFFKTQRMYILSPQQTIDCSGKFGNQGCKGGNVEKSFNYMKQDGVNAELHYPFEGKQGECRYDAKKFKVKVGEYVKVAANEQALKEAVGTKGTIAITINAPESFLNYKSGIYSDPKCKNDLKSLNHSVLLVGYGTDPNTKQPYWIIRNSYGLKWGESGYMRIAMNKNNMCGVATFALYPKLAA